jgi:crotonobetainyl-CoA:carnitine CoA-transferase CaiB-like acyl-CoA transferase
VRDIADIRQDPHLEAVGFFAPREHPTEGGYVDMKAPVRFAAASATPATPPPTLGQHTDEVRRRGWGAPKAGAPDEA